MAGDPVSWLLIEPGWKVFAADGAEVGRVEEILGDEEKDIFSGIAISSGLLPGPLAKARFVPAERIAAITEGEIRLDLPPDAIERLDEHQPAPAPEQIRP